MIDTYMGFCPLPIVACFALKGGDLQEAKLGFIRHDWFLIFEDEGLARGFELDVVEVSWDGG